MMPLSSARAIRLGVGDSNWLSDVLRCQLSCAMLLGAAAEMVVEAIAVLFAAVNGVVASAKGSVSTKSSSSGARTPGFVPGCIVVGLWLPVTCGQVDQQPPTFAAAVTVRRHIIVWWIK